jgi:hypothetical protein
MQKKLAKTRLMAKLVLAEQGLKKRDVSGKNNFLTRL